MHHTASLILDRVRRPDSAPAQLAKRSTQRQHSKAQYYSRSTTPSLLLVTITPIPCQPTQPHRRRRCRSNLDRPGLLLLQRGEKLEAVDGVGREQSRRFCRFFDAGLSRYRCGRSGRRRWLDPRLLPSLLWLLRLLLLGLPLSRFHQALKLVELPHGLNEVGIQCRGDAILTLLNEVLVLGLLCRRVGVFSCPSVLRRARVSKRWKRETGTERTER